MGSRIENGFFVETALTKLFVNASLGHMLSLGVIDEPLAAAAALDPIRNRLLSELREPASASELAARLEMPRQKVNYHVRTLESQGLVSVAKTRIWGGLTERLVVAKAASFVISPSALGPVGADPALEIDRLSASYLIALAARVVREVSSLIRGALDAKKKIATLSIDTVIRFRSAADRAEFTAALTSSINGLVARFHDETAIGGRSHRLLLMAHPTVDASKSKSED
jgi:DNA-binding transcriptional ArsR family regulator